MGVGLIAANCKAFIIASLILLSSAGVKFVNITQAFKGG
jgi:hypothetical protein